MECSAVILAGGSGRRLGSEKGLLRIGGKPMIEYVMEALPREIDDVMISVRTPSQAEAYSKIAEDRPARIVVDEEGDEAALTGIVACFKESRNDFALVLPCDTPLVYRAFTSFLAKASRGFEAVVPRWPNGYIEALHASYKVKAFLRASRSSISCGDYSIRGVVESLRNVLYVSTNVFKQVDPNLSTFFNVNSRHDLAKAKRILRGRTKPRRFSRSPRR